MTTLFNDNWQFSEITLSDEQMYKENKAIFLNPDDFFNESKTTAYKSVTIPHDWQIEHVKNLYKNSVGIYKKSFILSKSETQNKHLGLRFEGVYMNCGIWINDKKAGEWKYGYSTFEIDISSLVKEGENEVIVIAVYQNCNTRWYSGAGIYRDVYLINTPETFLTSDGTYFVIKNQITEKDAETSILKEKKYSLSPKWDCHFSVEISGNADDCSVKNSILDKNGQIIYESSSPIKTKPILPTELDFIHRNVPSTLNWNISRAEENFIIENPQLWSTENPYLYTAKTELFDKNGQLLDSCVQNCGFKTALFTKNEGFFLNGQHFKINGACHHHDLGCLGSAFYKNALRRQFLKLKEMGVNAVRCSHNPPPKAWLDLCDELGILVDDEAFDMWEKPKTPFDYGNYFNDWFERDATSWVRKDRNHPSLIMWSIGNEIYDTHIGNGYEITKKLYKTVRESDPENNAPITIASNYMMTEGAQNCAQEIDVVGYNYLERLYDEHHTKYPKWKIYGSETSSTIQSRGIYHFPDTLQLVTFSDGQCSTLGNCTTNWGAKNTQTVIANDRDCPFSAGQFIWTGWDYIGEPTPYHSKNSYFGQIDTAGFPKDTFYLYKAEWGGNKTKPFVHLLPYWDWNEGQLIDVKAYSNCDSVELFFNEKSLGLQKIDHLHGLNTFGQWRLEYHKGKIKAIGYDKQGQAVASEEKCSFEDPACIIIKPEEQQGDLFFIDLMTADKNQNLVENARNYITFNVTGDAELLGMDNGDSTDYDEYKSDNGKTHTRKLFMNRLVAVVKINKHGKQGLPSFIITAASKDLPTVSLKFDGKNWISVAPYLSIRPVNDFVPVRKIELINIDDSTTLLSKEYPQLKILAKIRPDNASSKEITWNPVLKECVLSDYIEISDKSGEGTGVESAIIKAASDGECILRCTSKNNSSLDEIISDLNITVSGFGNKFVNPYKLIEACRFENYDKGSDEKKGKPSISFESGITNRGIGPTWISFSKIDFGTDGADTIHLPVFSFETELPLEVWDGEPANGTDYNNGAEQKSSGTGECLGKFTYKHESIYNTFNENVFTLSKRLFGVHTISIVVPHELVFKGFFFDKSAKAYSKLRALDADNIVGDTFTKTNTAVEKIGNNVTLNFDNMDFGNKNKKLKLTICGKSNTENNTIHVKFSGKDDVKNQTIEFSFSDDYVEKSFDLFEVTGNQNVSFVFLPGCNFDFKWFKFE